MLINKNALQPYALSMAIAGLSWPISASAQTESDSQASTDLEEVVVTARKRQESLQDVPLSIQAYSGDDLALGGVDNVENLVGKTPNLSLSSNLLSPGNDFLNIVIRGVGSQSAGAPAVGTFVDGAFVPSLAFDIGFLDVERVEVLRGPQGTLFGRNTQGGALNIVVRRPDEEFRGKVALTYDEFDTVRAQTAFSGQLAENFFASIAADVSRTDGFLENPVVAQAAGGNQRGRSVPADDESKYSWRAAFRYTPSDELEVNLSIDKSYRRGLDGLPGVPRGTQDYIVRSDFQIDAEYDNYGAALNIDYLMGEIELTSITAYRKVDSSLPFDFDGSPERGPNFQDIRSAQELLSQELRFAGDWGDNINWLAGVYAFREEQLSDRYIQFGDLDLLGGSQLLVDAQIQNLDRSGYAVFADVIWNPNDWLELGFGARFAKETVKSQAELDFVLRQNGVDLATVVSSPSGKLDDDNISPTVSARIKLNEDISIYSRYARGFRAGGFPLAPASPISNSGFNSEISDNYELGIKGNLFDGQLDFDLALFRIDVSDQQLTTIVFFNGDPNLPVAAVGNAGESRSEGAELNINWQLSDSFELTASAGYTDAAYTNYIDTIGEDRSGERFPYVPKVNALIGANWSFDIANEAELELSAQYRYVGDILSGSGVDIDLQFPVDSYNVLDLRASLYKDDWRVDFFVDNAADKFVETRVFNSFFFNEPRPFSIVLPPRRAGVRFTYNF
ncbi:TonB-dependent receptor [Pseudoteredinibacter isoporae]|uniref:Iron complex outermembrane receptor protein n=1 Tax=Pseudoteredinibacter isoporae TaxID=570281 RepID=A0A7X0JWA9_9GAMM|nr:TonB-dependent receptor [Pseudoteredinibacter isoporae]MBB6522596.1 iron complex outermembrane receptor protein [Pseudoteredinibacter isoporae]NHO88126.1 TonB-dependent receptor [Pseudoteredinibacter isoporae]NIB23543.1 TonB-dependent receptor [Pseudoteredinibacter isoporae]